LSLWRLTCSKTEWLKNKDTMNRQKSFTARPSAIHVGVVIAVVFAVAVSAAEQPHTDAVLTDAHRTLLSARSFKCQFPWFASADWDSDQPTVKKGKQDDFGFHIDGIDHSRQIARLIGNVGSDDLAVVQGGDSVTFIEIVPAGTVNVTTVYAWRNPDGRFKAAHSRHTVIGVLAPGISVGGPAPSQNYGYCQVWH
jgi:hypothetical protein